MKSFRQYLPYYKNNLRIALPIVLTQLGGAFVSLADNIMVGHVGTTELAAVSFSSSIYFFRTCFGHWRCDGHYSARWASFCSKRQSQHTILFLQWNLVYSCCGCCVGWFAAFGLSFSRPNGTRERSG